MSVPKLRFDGFSGNWVTTQLGNICSFTQGVQIPQSEQINEERDGYIRYLYIRDFFSDKFKCYVPNIYPEKIIHPHEIMMVNTGNTTGEAYTRRYGVLSNNSFKIDYDLAHFNDQFMYLFCSSELAQNQIKKFFNAGGQPHLGHKNISQILISYPKKEEQTKIASFLSAVDEKISQLTQKHELLSQYKQGMMQKLFSQQLRFKADDGSEFGEWEKTTLGKVVNFQNGKRVPLSESDRQKRQGEYRYYGASGVIDHIDDYIFDGQYILIGEDGANIITRSSPLAFIVEGQFWVNNHAHIFQSKNGSNVFLAAYLESLNYEKFNSGTAQPKLNLDNLKKVPVINPCLDEQTKIANFLSAIDQKIEVVAQQIEQAKTWKKGLLQQMFV